MNGLKWICLILMSCCVHPAFAAVEPVSAQVQPKSFQTWKDLQVLDAQNQMLRVSARIAQIKSGKGAKKDIKEPAHLPSGRVKTTADVDPLSLAEKDLSRARESLESAGSLELLDYVNIYLPTLEAQPEALAALMQKLTKEELGDILKAILSKNTRIDTKRNSPVISGLPVGAPTSN